jgi:hypothetical protein
MAMPVPELPPRLEAAPDQAAEGDDDAAAAPLHVPAAPEPSSLQPAKLAVWRLFMEQVGFVWTSPCCCFSGLLFSATGMLLAMGAYFVILHVLMGACRPSSNLPGSQGLSVGAIAEVRHISRDSAEGYISEAIAAGFAYDWHRLGVGTATLASVAQQAAAAWAAAAAGANGGSGACAAADGAGPPAGEMQEEGKACAAGQTSSAAPGELDGSVRADGAEDPAAAAEGRQMPVLACRAGENLAQKLLAVRVGVKALKGRLPESVRYGQIRLALAHIGRLGMLPQLLADGCET